MLTNEERKLIDRLKEEARRIEEDYASGRMSEEEYRAVSRLFDEAEEKSKQYQAANRDDRKNWA